MADPGFGFGAGSSDDFERLARQYWGAWGDALRNATGAAPPDPMQIGARAWQDSIDWWTRQASGGGSPHGDTLWRFNRQAGDWYARMQQVAAQFGGGDASAGEIARAWKEAVGGSGPANVFADMARSMAGNGLHSAERWSEDAAPWLRLLRQEGSAWLHMPTFGVTREHQERMQALAQAQLEVQEASNAYNTMLLQSSETAFGIFERMLAEREAPGLQISSARALFDLWIDAAEQAYAEMALSKEYRVAYGNLANAQMRLRAGVQKEVEQASASLGMPTRSELDGAHRKIVELERSLRRLRDQIGQGAAAPAATARPSPQRSAKAAPRPTADRPAAGPSTRTTAARAQAAKAPTAPAAAAKKRVARPASGEAIATTPPSARKQAKADAPVAKSRASKAQARKPQAKKQASRKTETDAPPTAKAQAARAKPQAAQRVAPKPAAASRTAAGRKSPAGQRAAAKSTARKPAARAARKPARAVRKASPRPPARTSAAPGWASGIAFPETPQPLRRGRGG